MKTTLQSLFWFALIVSFILPESVQAVEEVLVENFEGSFPPTGWTIVNNVVGGSWQSNVARGVPNYCAAGSGDAAVAHPGDTNTVYWDTELRSPVVDLTQASWASLTYASMFQNYAGNGEIWVDISIDGGITWVTLRNQTSDDPPGGTPAPGGTSEIEGLAGYLGHTIILRWRFQASNTAAWCFHVDSVKVEAIFKPDSTPVSSQIIAPNVLQLGNNVSYSYIVEIKNSAETDDEYWNATMVNPLPAATAYKPGSLWCSTGDCYYEDATIHWDGSAWSSAYIFYTVEALSPVCGGSISNTAFISQPGKDEPVISEASTVTSFWDSILMDEPMTLFPPSGWVIKDYGNSQLVGSVFSQNDPGNRGNLTGGSDRFIIVDNEVAGPGATVEVALQTTALNIPFGLNTYLLFKTSLENMSGDESAEVQISTDGGIRWNVLWHRHKDIKGPHTASVDLTRYGGLKNVLFRFYYEDGGSETGWWQIDDIQIVSCPIQNQPSSFFIYWPAILNTFHSPSPGTK